MQWSSQLSADVQLSAGELVANTGRTIRQPIFEGLQLVVSLNASITGSVDDRLPFSIRDNSTFLVMSQGRHEGCDEIEPNCLQRYVRVAFDADGAQRLGLDPEALAHSAGERFRGDDVVVLRRELTPTVRALAGQILNCPIEGPLRNAFLIGKSLELMALAVSPWLDADGPVPAPDGEKVRRARRIAAERFHTSLSTETLSREVGMSPRRLIAAFRSAYGMSIAEYVQELRLQEGYRMLTTGAYSVADVACHVGYAIPHFSSLFKKRFGASPSALRPL